jgi:hypothetical protein
MENPQGLSRNYTSCCLYIIYFCLLKSCRKATKYTSSCHAPLPEYGIDPLLVGGDLHGLLGHDLAGVDDGGVGGGVPVPLRQGVVWPGVGLPAVGHLTNKQQVKAS